MRWSSESVNTSAVWPPIPRLSRRVNPADSRNPTRSSVQNSDLAYSGAAARRADNREESVLGLMLDAESRRFNAFACDDMKMGHHITLPLRDSAVGHSAFTSASMLTCALARGHWRRAVRAFTPKDRSLGSAHSRARSRHCGRCRYTALAPVPAMAI